MGSCNESLLSFMGFISKVSCQMIQKIKLKYVQNINNIIKSSYIAHRYKTMIKRFYGDLKKMRVSKVKLFNKK